MPSHWTYEECKAGDDLRQGDIISRTSEFVKLLGQVFPYFCRECYIGYLITTQSCDLVRRKENSCKATYISLAVIRELSPLLPEFLDEVCGSGIPRIYKRECKYQAEQLLVSIINQNEQSRGVFYLHQDADVTIAAPSVALLRVTFALRRQHYDLLKNARRGRLTAEYANKLGWLSGNLYSRVATPDWEDQEQDADASRKQARELLNLATEANEQNWVSEEWIKEAQIKEINLTSLTPENAYSELEKHAPPEPIEVIIQRIDAIERERFAGRDLRYALRSSDDFLRSFSENLVRAITGLASEERQKLLVALLSDSDFCEAVCQSVSSEAKKHCKSFPAQPIAAFLTALADKVGTIKPVLERLHSQLTTFDQTKLSNMDGDIRAAKLFAENVTEHIKAVAESKENELVERHRELAARLRSDARVKAVLRRLVRSSKVGNVN